MIVLWVLWVKYDHISPVQFCIKLHYKCDQTEPLNTAAIMSARCA